mmetsp:Transcript_51106/g.131811  ORF Transcript_51106/g.131811 Transcript_51106/m.131811 type:complete len:260 (-) Transcript_51106:544-1323(-)
MGAREDRDARISRQARAPARAEEVEVALVHVAVGLEACDVRAGDGPVSRREAVEFIRLEAGEGDDRLPREAHGLQVHQLRAAALRAHDASLRLYVAGPQRDHMHVVVAQLLRHGGHGPVKGRLVADVGRREDANVGLGTPRGDVDDHTLASSEGRQEHQRLGCVVEASDSDLLVEEAEWLRPQRRAEEDQIRFRDVESVVHEAVEAAVILGDEVRERAVLHIGGVVNVCRHTYAAELREGRSGLVDRAHEQDVRHLAGR